MSMYDYSQYENAIETAEAGKLLPDNTECIARLIGARNGSTDKSGETRDYITLRFDIPDEPTAFEIEQFLWSPTAYSTLDPKQLNSALYQMKCIARALGIDMSQPFAWEDHFGKEVTVVLGVQVDKSGQYRDKNTIKKFI